MQSMRLCVGKLLGILSVVLFVACASNTGPTGTPISQPTPATAITSTETQAVPTLRPSPIPSTPTALATPTLLRKSQIELKPCTIGNTHALCGSYPVYENRAAHSGRKIPLRIAVMPARSASPAPDPIFYFAGGPGGSAVDTLPTMSTAWGALNQQRDLVFVDQRGTGASNKLVCPLAQGATLDLNNVPVVNSFISSCLSAIDGDSRWYTTRAFVDDIDEVRAALGYDEINIAGGSYGATAVQVYTLVHPESVRTMTILNGTLLNFPIMEHIATSSQRALDLVLDRCEKDAACHAAYPNVHAEFQDALAQLDFQPVMSQVSAPESDQPILVTRTVFADVVHSMLMGADSAAQLPRLVHRASVMGDWDAVAQLYHDRILAQGTEGARMVMGITIRCHEPWAQTSLAQVEQIGTGSYQLENQEMSARILETACGAVPAPPPEAMYGAATKTNVPVLVLNSQEDAQNPPENVAAAPTIYSNSRILFEPYRSHYTVDWSCISEVVGEFVSGGDPQAIKGACLQNVKAFPFDTRP